MSWRRPAPESMPPGAEKRPLPSCRHDEVSGLQRVQRRLHLDRERQSAEPHEPHHPPLVPASPATGSPCKSQYASGPDDPGLLCRWTHADEPTQRRPRAGREPGSGTMWVRERSKPRRRRRGMRTRSRVAWFGKLLARADRRWRDRARPVAACGWRSPPRHDRPNDRSASPREPWRSDLALWGRNRPAPADRLQRP